MAMRRAFIPSFWRARSGSAAVEMALVAPIFLVLMFGSFDLGNYFMSEHVVVKAVRDGARYASRRAFAEYDCSTGTVSSDVSGKTVNLTRTGEIASGGTARLPGWTDDSTVTVAISCDSSGSYSGIYNGVADVPVVTVTASVPYGSLFKSFGIGPDLSLNASSQVTVMGV